MLGELMLNGCRSNGGHGLHWSQCEKVCKNLVEGGRQVRWDMAKRIFDEIREEAVSGPRQDGRIFDTASEAVDVFRCRLWNFGGVK
jgi:hypothetical protein